MKVEPFTPTKKQGYLLEPQTGIFFSSSSQSQNREERRCRGVSHRAGINSAGPSQGSALSELWSPNNHCDGISPRSQIRKGGKVRKGINGPPVVDANRSFPTRYQAIPLSFPLFFPFHYRGGTCQGSSRGPKRTCFRSPPPKKILSSVHQERGQK